MGASEQIRSPAPLSLVQYLTAAFLKEEEFCDLDQVDALGNLTAEKRQHALDVLSRGFKEHYTANMRLRIIALMREMRKQQRHAGARFMLDMFVKLEDNKILIARERALQAGAEGEALQAVKLWTENLDFHNDTLGIAHVAAQVPRLVELPAQEYQPALKEFITKLASIAPLTINNNAACEDLLSRFERLNKALTKHHLAEEARTLGQIAIDIKLHWNLQL